MKYSLFNIAALAGCLAIVAAAQANNVEVEDALKIRPDLSIFYKKLVDTGVIGELEEGQPYTIFAPTNDAFAGLPKSKYPCFYSSACKKQVAELLRKHIVPGVQHLAHISPNGGIRSLFSIDNQHIVVGKENKDDYTVDGQNVLERNQFHGGILYEIDGVMASDHDLAKFSTTPEVIIGQQPPAPPPLPPKVITTTTKDATTPIPYK